MFLAFAREAMSAGRNRSPSDPREPLRQLWNRRELAPEGNPFLKQFRRPQRLAILTSCSFSRASGRWAAASTPALTMERSSRRAQK